MIRLFTLALLTSALSPVGLWGQGSLPATESQPLRVSAGDSSGSPIVVSPEEDYRIAPSDVVEVYVLRAPELSLEYRVNAAGTIEMPFLGRVEARGKTVEELAADIADGLRDGGYLVDPQVSILFSQINRRFFIQGAVRQPGVYNIEGRPTLLELISIAGGLNGSYGGTAFIIRKVTSGVARSLPLPLIDDGTTPEAHPGYELEKANINALLRGEFTENVAINPGDIVHLPEADVFFVAGEVNAPGSFSLAEGTTLRQAISLAQGTSATASPGNAVIFREDGGDKVEIPIDVSAIMRGQEEDLPILPNDIVVVPNSTLKSAFLPVVNAFGSAAAWGVFR